MLQAFCKSMPTLQQKEELFPVMNPLREQEGCTVKTKVKLSLSPGTCAHPSAHNTVAEQKSYLPALDKVEFDLLLFTSAPLRICTFLRFHFSPLKQLSRVRPHFKPN